MSEEQTESYVQDVIQVNAPGLGCVLMRNNSGVLRDANGRPVRYGLGNQSKAHNDQIKSSDLIGFTKVQITPEMVGQTLAVFTAVEVKRPNWHHTPGDRRANAQLAFINWVKAAGGFAGFASSWADFRRILGV